MLYDSLEEALKREAKEQEIFIIGGESIYRQALPFADRIYATLVEQEPQEADALASPSYSLRDLLTPRINLHCR